MYIVIICYIIYTVPNIGTLNISCHIEPENIIVNMNRHLYMLHLMQTRAKIPNIWATVSAVFSSTTWPTVWVD